MITRDELAEAGYHEQFSNDFEPCNYHHTKWVCDPEGRHLFPLDVREFVFSNNPTAFQAVAQFNMGGTTFNAVTVLKDDSTVGGVEAFFRELYERISLPVTTKE